MKKIFQFFKECAGELRKVTWPTRSDVLSSTKVVFISTIIVALILGLLDWLFTEGLRLVFQGNQMARSWYILQTYSGYEQKIQRTLATMLTEQKLDSNIVFQVKVPMEEVVEISNGKKHVRNNLILPGYIMIEMDLPQIGWKNTCSLIRRVQGVTGFVGVKPSEKPRPISTDEAKNILQMAGELKGEKQVRIKQNFEVGETVKITEGPFATFSGAIEDINTEKNKLRVNVQIFGRATPVEVDVLQVEKI